MLKEQLGFTLTQIKILFLPRDYECVNFMARCNIRCKETCATRREMITTISFWRRPDSVQCYGRARKRAAFLQT